MSIKILKNVSYLKNWLDGVLNIKTLKLFTFYFHPKGKIVTSIYDGKCHFLSRDKKIEFVISVNDYSLRSYYIFNLI